MKVLSLPDGSYLNTALVRSFYVQREFTSKQWVVCADEWTLIKGIPTEDDARSALATLLQRLSLTVVYG